MLIDDVIRNQMLKNNPHGFILKLFEKKERKLLKVFLLSRIHQLFFDYFKNQLELDTNFSMECYAMDNKLIQFLINGIIKTGEYTLEGISYHTHIPFDIIFDAVCGINNQFSMTLWIKIINLYLEVNPDITNHLVDQLLELKSKDSFVLSSILKETI